MAQTYKFLITVECTTERIVKANSLEEAQAAVDNAFANGSISPIEEDDDPQASITFYDSSEQYDDDDVDYGFDLTK